MNSDIYEIETAKTSDVGSGEYELFEILSQAMLSFLSLNIYIKVVKDYLR